MIYCVIWKVTTSRGLYLLAYELYLKNRGLDGKEIGKNSVPVKKVFANFNCDAAVVELDPKLLENYGVNFGSCPKLIH